MSIRTPDRSEILADAVMHVLGAALGLAGVGFLVPRIIHAMAAGAAIALALYAIGLLAMLGFSAAYNLSAPSRRREWLRRFDHAAIFIMIAGTYSPLTIGRVSGAWSAWLAAAVWLIAILGAGLKLAFPRRYDRLAVVAYLLLGWLGIVAIGPLLRSMPVTALLLLGIGGVLYSGGVVFHLWQRLRFQNAVWHGFVLAGAACHYAAVLLVT
jgi:hemolysin III